MAVGLVSDIVKMLKDEQAQIAGTKKWEDIILSPAKALAEAEAEAVSTQTKYDISDAYANYKKSEMNIARNTRLGSGFKRQIASDLKSAYQQQYGLEKAEEYGAIADIESKYTTSVQQQLAEREKELTDYATKLSQIEDYMFKFAGIEATQENLEKLGYYARVGDTNEFEITDLGRDVYDKTLHSANAKGELFSQYLGGVDKDLYEFYTKNKGAFNELIAGLDPTDVSYSSKTKTERWENHPEIVENYIADKNYENELINAVGLTSTDFTVWSGGGSDEAKFRNQNLANKVYEIATDLGISDKYNKQTITEKLHEIVNKISNTPGYRGLFMQAKNKITVGKDALKALLKEMAKEASKVKNKK